jgi:cytoskeletal protein CcmA (bactofilin family)
MMRYHLVCEELLIKTPSPWSSILRNNFISIGANTTTISTKTTIATKVSVPASIPSTGDMQMILGNSKPERSQQDDLSSPRPVVDVRPIPMSSETRMTQPSSAQTDPRATTVAAVIGAKIRFIGELVGEEDLLIQGYVEGTIDLRGNSLTVGKHGVVKANVLAKNVTIEGKVEGDVFGEERIAVKSSSQVRGNLVAERVTLEEGAKFKGSIDMDMESRKEEFKSFNQKSALRPLIQTDKIAYSKPADPTGIE